MSEKRLLLELKLITKTPPHTQNPQILRLYPTDPEESLFKWTAIIAKPTKTDSPFYYNGQWKLDIEADSSYPIKPPKVQFSNSTPINHPNIKIDSGEICLDILRSDGWTPAWNLQSLVGAILMLLDDPEPDSPLNVDLANLFRHDPLAFESIAQYTIWKNLTLYEGERDQSGVKSTLIFAYECSNEEEDEVSSDNIYKDEGQDEEAENGSYCPKEAVEIGEVENVQGLSHELAPISSPTSTPAAILPAVTSSKASSITNEEFNVASASATVSETSSISTATSTTVNEKSDKPKSKSSKKRGVSRMKERVLNRISHQVDEIRRHQLTSLKDGKP